MISKPAPEEFASFYAGYIDRVSESGPVAALEKQRTALAALAALPDEKANHRYADDKWTVKEVLGHMADAERVFSYRMLRIARGDTTPLAGFDEALWAASAPHRHRPVADIVGELLAVREATLALIGSMDDAALVRTAVANGKPVSARALCWIAAGHAQHHLLILSERYNVRDALGPLTTKAWEPGVLGG